MQYIACHSTIKFNNFVSFSLSLGLKLPSSFSQRSQNERKINPNSYLALSIFFWLAPNVFIRLTPKRLIKKKFYAREGWQDEKVRVARRDDG